MEFQCPDPTATVRAANVRATLDAFRMVPSLGRRLIEKHRLAVNDLRPDHFVPVQHWLDAMRDIQQEVGNNVLREVGAHIVRNADFPPAFASAEAVLESLDTIYYLNHRGDVGHYRVRRVSDGTIEVRCETPYPRYFEWGLVEGICRNKCAGRRRYDVAFESGPPQAELTAMLRVHAV